MTKHISNPTPEQESAFMQTVAKTLTTSVKIHLLKDGNVALQIEVADDVRTPKDYDDFIGMSAEDIKLTALKSELIHHLQSYHPTRSLANFLADGDKMLERVRSGEPCDCPNCSGTSELEDIFSIKHKH